MSILQDIPQHSDNLKIDIFTTQSDATRASVRICGTLDSSNAPLLAQVIAGHVRSRRRFLRLDVANLSITDAEALAVVHEAHQALLEVRGTLILTGVTRSVRNALTEAGLERELFLVHPMAFEQQP